MPEYTIVIPLKSDLCNLRETVKSINQYSQDHEIFVIVGEDQKVEAEIVKTLGAKPVIMENYNTLGMALNQAITEATGKYIIILKDNTLVAPEWLTKLKRTFAFPSSRNATIAVPLLNYSVFTAQQCPINLSATNYVKELEENKFNQSVTLTHIISDVCFMFEKDSGLQFDGSLKSGEVFDFTIRNTLAGNICAINRGAFVFDKNPLIKIEDLADDMLGVVKVHNNYFARKQSILGIVRTKLTNEFETKAFWMCFNKMMKVADKILILVEKGLPAKGIEDVEVLDCTESINSAKVSMKIIDKIKELNYDWILYLKSNEVLEENITREDIDHLIQNPNPLIHGYIFQEYTFKNFDDNYITNQNSNRSITPQLFRYIPSPKLKYFNMLLSVDESTLRTSSIRYKQYDELLKNQIDSKIKDWIPNNKIDVCTIMKNEKSRLFWYMNRHYGFANKVILVDTGSTDGSIEIAKLLGAEVYECPTGSEDFSKARNIYLEKSKAEWIFIVDLDEYCEDLVGIRNLSENSKQDHWLFKIANLRKNGTMPTSETIRLFRNKEGLVYKGIIHELLDINKPMTLAPVQMVNEGYLDDDEVIAERVRKYFDMCIQRIRQEPNDVRTLCTIALHLFDDARYKLAIAVFNKAIKLMPSWHLPRKDLATVHLHYSRQLYKEVIEMINPQHPDGQECRQIVAFMNQHFKTRIGDAVDITKDMTDNDILELL